MILDLLKKWLSKIEPLTDMIVNVPQDFTTIHGALDFIKDKRIAPDCYFTIKVSDGVYTLTEPLIVNHPDGQRINLIGNRNSPDDCVITVANTPSFDALIVSNGHCLGYIDGFKFNLQDKANNYTAILALNGARIICGQAIKVNNWYYGIAARNGSFVSCNNANVSNSGDVGIWAFCGSHIDARNSISTGAKDEINNLGFGIQAEYGSSIDCSGAQTTGNKIGGIAALSGSSIRALNCISTLNIGSGFFVRDKGTIETHGSVASNNDKYGIEEIADGSVHFSNMTFGGNVLGDKAPIAKFDNSNLGARVVANAGETGFRIDTNTENGIYFHTAGGLQFGIQHKNQSKNHIETASGGTGEPVKISAVGNDPNIDIHLNPKGSGMVRIGKHYAGNITPNGYIEFKLSDGAVVRINAQRL